MRARTRTHGRTCLHVPPSAYAKPDDDKVRRLHQQLNRARCKREYTRVYKKRKRQQVALSRAQATVDIQMDLNMVQQPKVD